MLRSPIKWLGGKSHLIRQLLPYLNTHHQTYVSVFGGGATDILAKHQSVGTVEVYNDIDENLVQLFCWLKDPQLFPTLFEQICLTPYSRKERCNARTVVRDSCDSELFACHSWFTTARQSFSGFVNNNTAWGFSKVTNAAVSYTVAINRLPQIHKRMKDVVIHNEDWRKVLSRYDSTGTLFYLDPPYVITTRESTTTYDHELDESDHVDLVSKLLKLKGSVLLSGYANGLYLPLEETGWVRKDFDTVCFAAARTRATGLMGTNTVNDNQARVESIWVSPTLMKKIS
jgi:DNA adenine methylase